MAKAAVNESPMFLACSRVAGQLPRRRVVTHATMTGYLSLGLPIPRSIYGGRLSEQRASFSRSWYSRRLPGNGVGVARWRRRR